METVLKGTKNIVHIAPDKPTVLIGKRVSPARRKRSMDGAGEGYIEIAKNEGLAQVAAGAEVVEVAVPDLEPVALLPRIVETLQQVVEVPLCLDAANPEALAAALEIYRGKPLVNAVSGTEESLNQVLPLIARHKTAVIARCVDETGLANDPDERLEIARIIIERAESLGIPREDILVDCQTVAVEADSGAAAITLETIRLIRIELGVNMTLNIGDIAAELPYAVALHQAFLTAAIVAGVNAPIANASQARQSILATDVLLGRDKQSMRYIRYYHFRRSGMRDMVDWELMG